MNLDENYLQSVKKLFAYYKSLGDKTFEQLNESDFFWKPDEKSNSIAILIQHIAGNMLSRWTDFLNSDGEKEWRDREQEFELYLKDQNECIAKWEEGWACLNLALSELNAENFNTTIYIRAKGHTVLEAINRQLGHYSYHIGQLVYLGRQCAGKWESLSIPKGESQAYNIKSFDQGKRMEHFTDEFVDKDGLA